MQNDTFLRLLGLTASVNGAMIGITSCLVHPTDPEAAEVFHEAMKEEIALARKGLRPDSFEGMKAYTIAGLEVMLRKLKEAK